MAAERLSMRKLREVIRLHCELGLSGRAIATSVGSSASTVLTYLGRIRVAGLTWPLPPELDSDEALTQRLFPDEGRPQFDRPEPDWREVQTELRRKGVTKLLLWQEYKAAQPDGLQYSQFCERFSRWLRTVSVSMRQIHRAGEKMFVDFSGDGLPITDPATGEQRIAKLFVAVLGGSSLTYAEPAWAEDLESWVGGHVRAVEFFGGVTELWVNDNLKAGVLAPDRYEPDLNPTYAELAEHYGVAVLPARVRKPKDKAKAEAAVWVAERWILAVLRKRTFFSLEEFAAAVRPLVARLNDRVTRHLRQSRRQLFEGLERAALRPLPEQPYEMARWAKERVRPHYHVEYDEHWYSVPYVWVDAQADLRATSTTVEVMVNRQRVASHVRSQIRGGYTTDPAHMPRAHREYAEWTPVKLCAWAQQTGPSTVALVEEILRRHTHPQKGFQSCLGLLSLARQYEAPRLEAACARALAVRACSYKSVQAILRHGLDRVPVEAPATAALPAHSNVRGSDYYH
jgi:transposase